MPKFVTIGYGDEAGCKQISPDLRIVAHAHDNRLKHMGALIGIAESPVQVRNPDARGVEVRESAYRSTRYQ